MRVLSTRVTATLWVTGVLLIVSNALHASPRSRELIELGVTRLQDQRYATALKSFDEAAAADPDDAQAPFFQGVALNRLGRHDQALDRLEQAERMGADHPDMAFESGWALLGAERYREAIGQLEWFERAYPGRGQTLEFMGRAHFHLGNLDRAEALLHRAIERDADLKPTAQTYLALITRRRGDERGAAQQIASIVTETPGSPISEVIGRYTQRGGPPDDTFTGTPGVAPLRSPVRVPPEAPKRWRVTVSAGAGYNDNVLAIADGFALPADITDKESIFARLTLNAAYDLVRDDANLLTARYAVGTNLYEQSVDQADLLDQYLSLSYHRKINDKATASVRLSDQYTLLGGNSFRNRLSVRPAVARRLTDWLAGELAYSFAFSEYMFDTTAVTDRDGASHTVTLTGYWLVPDTRLRGRAGYFFNTNTTDGSDFDFDSHGLFLNVRHPLMWEIEGEVTYTHIFEDYDNLNSFTTPVAFAKKRDDDVDIITAQLSRAFDVDFARRARVYVRYDYTHNNSNVAFFDYDQHEVVAGFILDF